MIGVATAVLTAACALAAEGPDVTVANQSGAPLAVTVWRGVEPTSLGTIAPSSSSHAFTGDGFVVLELAPRVDGRRYFSVTTRWLPHNVPSKTLIVTRDAVYWRGVPAQQRFEGVVPIRDAPAPLGRDDTCIAISADDETVPKSLRLMPLPAGLVTRDDDAPMSFHIAAVAGETEPRWYWFQRATGELVLSSYDRFYGFELEFSRVVFAPVMHGTATYFNDSSPRRTDRGEVTLRVVPCPAATSPPRP